MKTIQVSDEMYDALKALANEIKTQDNRCTAKPYIFQIRVTVKDYGNLDGDEVAYHTEDWDELIDDDQLIEYLGNDIPDEIKEILEEESFLRSESEQDFLEKWLILNRRMEKILYQTRYEYKNAFLTEKSCKEHIERNYYHYNEPVDYLDHAYRNPDMDLVFGFLKTLEDGE